MAKEREIKNRIKAVGNIQRITQTMKMIATARFQASQKRTIAAQPYTRKIGELVGELATSAAAHGEGTFSHPLLQSPQPPVGRELLLVITSDRGLCGAYNASLIRTANQYLVQRGDQPLDLEVVGNKGVGYFKFRRIEMAAVHQQFGDSPAYEQVVQLAEQYMERFAAGQYDAVKVLYMAFESISRQKPTIAQLLPQEDPTAATGGEMPGTMPQSSVDYEFSPDAATLLSDLLPVAVKIQLYQWFNEAIVSEHIARMVAMNAATDNAGQMTRSLTRQYNRQRQAAITTELTEIIGGAAALA